MESSKSINFLHLNHGAAEYVALSGNRMHTQSTLLTDESVELCACLKRLSDEKRDRIPLSTYRLQFNRDFRFEDARRLVPYLAKLGITHCYASPILKARSGSPHGYDIIDHNQLNPEIGSESEFLQLVAELKAHGMALLLDIVPNHMGVGHGDNPWWQDVLQNGRASAYADFFDIDWEPLNPELRNKVLTPVLGNPYGEDLEAGHIRISFDDGKFVAKYFDKVLPIDPQTFPLLLRKEERRGRSGSEAGSDAFAKLNRLMDAFGGLPENSTTDPEQVERRGHEMPMLLEQLKQLAADSQPVQVEIERAVQAVNGVPGHPESFNALHALLERQVYRLAFWRVSGEEINYRRFFDINDLVGLRMENPRVFAETHKLIRQLLADGLISGLRIDHPDGLLNPEQYFVRLQRLYTASRCLGGQPSLPTATDGIELEVHAAFGECATAHTAPPLFVVIEKILEHGEHLHGEWPVDGSVGYDFANLVNGVLIERRNEQFFTKLYYRVIDGMVRIDRLLHENKRLVMRRALASEVNVLTHILNEISNQDRHARDFTRGVLREAIRETIACFPIYRTYIDESGRISESDRNYLRQAIECAKRWNGTIAPTAFDFLHRILLLQGGADKSPSGYQRQLYFTLKFQQLTGPVMAKGLEDTTCYVYARFISNNEVGGTPARFGIPVSEFHHGNQERAERWPASMLSTSTHDTKRSEDVRARLNVLSEMPNTWAAEVMKWRRINRNRKLTLPDGRVVPDDNEEYFLYQTIVGAWPLHLKTGEERKEWVGRIQQYMQKAVHEAKVNLSWLNPNPEYVSHMDAFIASILAPRHRAKANLFWDSLQKFLPTVMYFGAMNSIVQTLLKFTCPGIPDVYQGQEMWDFSLVDPDNRRPVDFDLRWKAAAELCARSKADDLRDVCRDILGNYRDGRLKLWVTMRALNCRRQHRRLFQTGDYTPLSVGSGREEHVIAFAREHKNDTAIVAVPRLSLTLMKGKEEPPIGEVWGDSELALPPNLAGKTWSNVFTGERLVAGDTILCREVFRTFPVALLTAD
ncbi:MAG TPA: malto-oligosyltrehalose synthase [Alloacidobacterium sp.]|nr:malto-oligosyltrehalose synthase [Alloacidobacterium sp.]